jgi:Na+/H+ antiporter NhaA
LFLTVWKRRQRLYLICFAAFSALNRWFFILPLFAGKYGDSRGSNIGETIAQHYSIGIALGLIVGKPLGIYLFSLWPYP